MPDPDPNLAHLHAIARAIRVPWHPHPALSVNQATLRVVKLEGHSPDFHTHDIDECYVVLDGEALIELDGAGSTHLAKGDAYVVRAGTRHRPLALPHASILLIT
ncbi:MAG TPA: cupin domain-containing protein [Polyangiaceae bacterium]|jgi:mannose-6-phosphate isomerase-like protein (cupin superfamily)|nr:cupin domain-containing protein [Polyangiaceae bacterium]